jgi:hypothetical protein
MQPFLPLNTPHNITPVISGSPNNTLKTTQPVSPIVIDQNAKTPTDFSEIFPVTGGVGVDFNRERYPDLTTGYFTGDIESLYESKQSFLKKSVNALGQFGLITGASFLNTVAEPFIQASSIVGDTSNSYDNWFTKLTHDALAKGQDWMPIYKKNENSFLDSASNTVWQTVPQVGFSIGTMAGILAVDAAMTAVAPESMGTSLAAAVSTTSRGLKRLTAMYRENKKFGQFLNALKTDVVTVNAAKGLYLNSVASSMEAGVEAYGIKDELIKKGITDEDVIHKAAMQDFWINKAILSITNIPMLGMFTKYNKVATKGLYNKLNKFLFDSDPTITAKSAKDLLKGNLSVNKAKLSAKLFNNFIVSGTSESFEEFSQTLASESILSAYGSNPQAYYGMGSILQDMVKKAPAFAKDRQGIDAIASGFIMGALMGGGRIGINKVAGAIAGDLKYEIDPTKITESSKFKKLGKYLFDSTANTEQRLTQQVERIKDSIKRNPNQFDNAVKENIANLSKEFNYIENNLRRKFDSKIVDLNEQLSNPDITQEQKKELESQIELLNTNKESALQSIIENEEVSSLLGETNNLEYLTEVKKQLDTLNTTYNKADDGKITFNTDIIDTLLETSLAKESSNMMAQFLDAGLKLDSFLRDANTNEESRNNLKLNSLSVLTSLKANYIDFLHTNGLDATTPFRIEGLAMLNEEGKKQMGLPDDLSIETINNNLTEFLDVYSTHHNTALNDAKNKKVTFPDSYNEGVYNEAGELTYEGVLAEGESITYEDENGKSITVTGEKGGNTPKPKVSKVYTKDTGQAAAVEAFVKKEYARAIARNVLLMNFYSDSLEELQSMFGENHAYLDLEVFKYATAKQLPATRVEIETLQSELDILKEGNSSEKLIKERIKYIEDKIKLLNEIVDKFEKDKVKGQFRYRGDNIATDLNKLVFELMLLEHNFNYKNSEFKIDYKGIKVFEKELLGDINDIIKLIQTKEELFAVYKAMLNKNDLTDFYKFIMAKRQEEAIARYMATEQYQKRLEFESLFESMGMSLPKDDKIEKLKTKLEDDPFSEIRLDILATEEATSADTTSPASNVPGTPDAPEEKTNEEVEDKTEINQEAIDEVKEALKDFKKYEIFEEDFIKDSNESIILSDNKITEFSEILTEDGDSILLFNDKDHQYYTLERENGKLIVKKDIISRSKFENDAKGKEDTPVNSIATNIGNELDTLNRIIYGNNNPIDTKNETALNEEVERIKNEAGAINPKYTNSFIQTLIELKEQFREENNVYEFITDPLIFKDKYKLKDNLSIGFSPDLLVITNDGKLIVHEFKSSKNSYESNKNSYQSQLLVYQAIINDLLSQNVNTNGENSKVVFVNTSGNFNTQDAGVREIPSNLNAKAHLNKLKQDYNNNISKENEEVLSLFEDGSFEVLQFKPTTKTTTQSKIEAKKADIERRRQEEISNIGIKQKAANFEKLREAKNPEEQLNAINTIERNVLEGLQLSDSEKREIQTVKDKLAMEGYENVDLLGMTHHKESNNVAISAIADDTLEDDIQIITKIKKPQINKDGRVIQTAQYEVTVGTKKGGLTKEEWLKEQSKKETRADKINAKYDAELQSLESKQTPLQPTEESKQESLPVVSDNDKIFNKLDKAGKKKVLEAIQDLISDNNKFQLKSFINSDGLETILILKDGFYHDIANQKRYSEESLKEFSLIDYNLQKDNLNKVIEKMLEDLDKDVDVNFTTEKTTNSETGLEDYSSFAKDGKSYIYLNSVILSLPEIVNEESAHTIQDTEVASILDLDFITMEDFAALLNNTSNDKDNFKIENC